MGRGRARAAVLSAPLNLTPEAARRFLVARHFLAPARSLADGPDSVLTVIRKLGSIQFDPIAVAGRNHDLVLHARVADYDPRWCESLYERRADRRMGQPRAHAKLGGRLRGAGLMSGATAPGARAAGATAS